MNELNLGVPPQTVRGIKVPTTIYAHVSRDNKRGALRRLGDGFQS